MTDRSIEQFRFDIDKAALRIIRTCERCAYTIIGIAIGLLLTKVL